MVRSTAASAVVMADEHFRLLLLHATYDGTWQFPGGTVEHGQDPWCAAVREVTEETSLRLTGPPRLLGIDWRQLPDSDRYTQYYFAGPRLSRQNLAVVLSDEHDA